MTILYFIIALGILVIVHEWGHFIVARKSGIRVLKFSIGFGPKLFGFKKGDTEYRVSLIPLGGYVQLYGLDEPLVDSKGSKISETAALPPDAYTARPLWARLSTVFGGPVMNLVLALILMPIAFMVGRTVPVILEKNPVVLGVKNESPAETAGFQKGDQILKLNNQEVKTWGDFLNFIALHPNEEVQILIERNGDKKEVALKTIFAPNSKHKIGYSGLEPFLFWGDNPIIGGVASNTPAEKAGLQEKDRIVSINGHPVSTWTEMTESVRASEGKAIELSIMRDNKPHFLYVTPVFNEAAQGWVIGVTKYVDPSYYTKKRYSLFPAIVEGTKENLKLTKLTGEVLGRLFTFQLSYKALGGPIQIAQASAMAAQSGLADFLYFLCFLSLQLGILNLLPIPVLDGGHVLFMVIEGIRKKPVSEKVRLVSQQAGLFFLLGLMILVTFNDVDSVWGFNNIWEKIRGIF